MFAAMITPCRPSPAACGGDGVPVKDSDAARLSPLGHAHLNVLGRYSISSSTPAEGLRQLGEIPDLPAFPDGGGVQEEEA
ncbi:hypothetical protein [Microbispora sp. H10830]|uniref:hypothetical protein n=1 Tax=Microbispora sp. H10830 TaxID=2729109 RepID=UPI0016022330|nr:hypothetical protein [Microbispora sp. H10830]